ncbi:MAG: HTTM domain-containing protein [Mycobacterium sp.]
MRSTIDIKHRIRDGGQTAWSSWHRFWFTVSPAYTLGLVRIVFGVLIIAWTLELKTNFYMRFGSQGVVPVTYDRSWSWSVFEYLRSDDALLLGWVVLLAAATALTIGWQSRIAAIVVFVLIMSFERRNPWVFNAGDMLLRVESVMIMLAPCGAALSVDQWRRSGSFFSSRDCKQWALRLMQVQVSIIYLSTVIAKLRGETWQNGTAVLYSLRQVDMLAIPTPEWLTSNLLIMNAVAWGTLIIECSIGVLIWNRRWRPWVLAAGVMLHLGISMTLEVGLFSFAVFVLYLSFVPNQRVKAGADWLQRRLAPLMKHRRMRPDNKPAEPHDNTSESTPAAVEESLPLTPVPVAMADDPPQRRRPRRRERSVQDKPTAAVVDA